MLMLSDPIRHWDRLSEQAIGGIGAMDAYRNGDVITVQFDLPGVDPASIDLQIERGELRVTAQRRIDHPKARKIDVRHLDPSTSSPPAITAEVA